MFGQLLKTFLPLGRGSIMLIEWREREHEGTENEALNVPDTINILRQCGLLKYFQISSMRSKTLLL